MEEDEEVEGMSQKSPEKQTRQTSQEQPRLYRVLQRSGGRGRRVDRRGATEVFYEQEQYPQHRGSGPDHEYREEKVPQKRDKYDRNHERRPAQYHPDFDEGPDRYNEKQIIYQEYEDDPVTFDSGRLQEYDDLRDEAVEDSETGSQEESSTHQSHQEGLYTVT